MGSSTYIFAAVNGTSRNRTEGLISGRVSEIGNFGQSTV